MIFPANRKPSQVMKSSKHWLYLPVSPIATKLAPFLGFWFIPVTAVRGNHLKSSRKIRQVIEVVAIVGPITDEPIRSIFDDADVDGRINHRYFVGGNACRICSNRNTKSVCDCNKLVAFSTFRLAEREFPIFVGTKVSSMMAPRMSIQSRFRTGSLPASKQCAERLLDGHSAGGRRRWRVRYCRNRWGTFFQEAPVRNKPQNVLQNFSCISTFGWR